ncbi:MAG TPA: DUF512 domain-containing protein [Candidatus Deferrimicrobium sp.]|nr:DUF512 domain-containing protein [Candidatus Deferrimicrobium sp.]
MKIVSVDPTSPLFGHVRPGYELVAINDRKVLDSLDYHFRTADECVTLRFSDRQGQDLTFTFDASHGSPLGLTFADDRIRQCNCDCIFCFVRQQPEGLRPSLYVKDEDYRLSFTHGNFITLSNLTRPDIERIIAQRLSPLYVSVHSTDDRLRRCLLRNEKLAPIIPRLKYVTDHGITIHAQTVLCPGINDGAPLEKTIEDLVSLHPGVATLAVVPVGLTRYRAGLTPLRVYTPEEAKGIIRFVEVRQVEFLARMGTRFVWPADEFYVLADMNFPSRASYEQMSQFENGVGMVREFINLFQRRRQQVANTRSNVRLLIFTGCSAYPFLNREILSHLRNSGGLNISAHAVVNRFWGETVTVSGLLTGQDLLAESLKLRNSFDVAMLPPNCLNTDSLLLDDMSLDDFRTAVGKRVIVGKYDLVESLREALT